MMLTEGLTNGSALIRICIASGFPFQAKLIYQLPDFWLHRSITAKHMWLHIPNKPVYSRVMQSEGCPTREKGKSKRPPIKRAGSLQQTQLLKSICSILSLRRRDDCATLTNMRLVRPSRFPVVSLTATYLSLSLSLSWLVFFCNSSLFLFSS